MNKKVSQKKKKKKRFNLVSEIPSMELSLWSNRINSMKIEMIVMMMTLSLWIDVLSSVQNWFEFIEILFYRNYKTFSQSIVLNALEKDSHDINNNSIDDIIKQSKYFIDDHDLWKHRINGSSYIKTNTKKAVTNNLLEELLKEQ